MSLHLVSTDMSYKRTEIRTMGLGYTVTRLQEPLPMHLDYYICLTPQANLPNEQIYYPKLCRTYSTSKYPLFSVPVSVSHRLQMQSIELL